MNPGGVRDGRRGSQFLRCAATAWAVCFLVGQPSGAQSKPPLLAVQADGTIAYTTDERGNRIPDFSSCGYAGGTRAIPQVAVRLVVPAQPGDATARIQQAIDHVSNLPTDAHGVRGAVLLLRGQHTIRGALRITQSGVVLRGQGMGDGGTTLVAVGEDRRTLIQVQGRHDRRDAPSARTITDPYVPVGAVRLHLEDAAHLRPGDWLRIVRPGSQKWIDFLGAHDFGGGVGGGWKPGTRDIAWHRTVQSVEGNCVTLDAPLTTALEQELGGGTATSFTWPGRITHSGIENLRLESTFAAERPRDEDHSWCAITLEDAADAWVRQVTCRHFAGSAVAIQESCQRISVQDCLSLAPVSEVGGYRRHTFFTQGQQTLFLRCYAENGRHDFSVGHCAAGPNAFVQCEARGALADSGPMESWASGVLYDNVVIDGHALTLGYRPGNNAGIGWSAANCVLWNCSAAVIRCWNPPGAQNWSCGSWASFEGDGIWRSSNEFMEPDSLWQAQVRARYGESAAARSRLMPRPRGGSSNPSLELAQQLTAASRQPAPQLFDYIVNASEREPLPDQPGGAGHAPETPASPLVETPARRLAIRQGWLTVDNQLLVGGTAAVAWWRGSIQSGEAATHGIGITRFVPGRVGPGLTDDLTALADTLAAEGKVAVNHNYGLWYDRRRDDHQRTRRIDGDVLPPFFEQPFARSGRGTAWDGLSQYDLTRFNPWYWSRLREFASLCDQRGLVLFHQNYFQHPILEAGAHWADSPWRSANNINDTGFPEPPPYAGDKRIFQAELFYDVNHVPRRQLHERYLQQCLENFSSHTNVVQFTGAEFTGPQHFVEFWCDTIARWKQQRASAAVAPQTRSTGDRFGPLIALSATKDVQDAILADPVRSQVVDVVDFRYWWRTDRGQFAPPGGKNLALRQFERQWRGGRPRDVHLAGMAAEYRTRFPEKPVICDFETAGWAWVCAGGSLPRLPQQTDPQLLVAIPRMEPWRAASGAGRWVLREPGRQLLMYSATPGELDLASEPGRFEIHQVDEGTGQVKPRGFVMGGGRVELPPATILWLIRK